MLSIERKSTRIYEFGVQLAALQLLIASRVPKSQQADLQKIISEEMNRLTGKMTTEQAVDFIMGYATGLNPRPTEYNLPLQLLNLN